VRQTHGGEHLSDLFDCRAEFLHRGVGYRLAVQLRLSFYRASNNSRSFSSLCPYLGRCPSASSGAVAGDLVVHAISGEGGLDDPLPSLIAIAG